MGNPKTAETQNFGKDKALVSAIIERNSRSARDIIDFYELLLVHCVTWLKSSQFFKDFFLNQNGWLEATHFNSDTEPD